MSAVPTINVVAIAAIKIRFKLTGISLQKVDYLVPLTMPRL